MRIPHWDYLSWARDRFGAAHALYHYPPAFWGPVKAKGVYLRPGSSDQDVYDSVFIKREYDVAIPEPRIIVDAGAHIGLASVWFARRYPHAKIIALEPNDDNYRMLVKNTRGLDVETLKCGLWSADTHLRIVNESADNWSFRVIEDPRGQIEAVTVDYLMRKYGPIDCLKIDIEGSEKTVLEHSASWMPNVTTLIVELHDRFMPGCTAALKAAIAGQNFRHSISGENQILVRV